MSLATVLSLSILGQDVLPGSKLSLEQAQEKAQIIVVAELIRFDVTAFSGAVWFRGGMELTPSTNLKGKPKEGKKLIVSASGPGVLPEKGQEHIYFIEEYEGHFTVVKMLSRTESNIAAVRKVVEGKNR
jgi:hypothetical protein